MAYIAPPTFVVGAVLTAAQMNVLGGDITFLHSLLPGVAYTGTLVGGSPGAGFTPLIVAGSSVGVTGSGSGTLSISFGFTFPGGVAAFLPTVGDAQVSGTTNQLVVALDSASSISTTSATVICYESVASAVTVSLSTTVRVNWIAMGW